MNQKYELFEKIISYVKGREILDIGFVDHDLEKSKSPLWVHAFLRKYSKNVFGIDILKESIKELKQKGYNVAYGNAENFSIKKKFDLIFAGELIEHLSNPGLFLDRCKKHLKKGGVLILTTPNSFNLTENIKNVIYLRANPRVNPEHTCYYTPRTITELIRRSGLSNRFF